MPQIIAFPTKDGQPDILVEVEEAVASVKPIIHSLYDNFFPKTSAPTKPRWNSGSNSAARPEPSSPRAVLKRTSKPR